MGLINPRDLLQFPGGDNSSDTVVNGVHLNLTPLQSNGYELYTNDTISNGSNCYLAFDRFMPTILSNGTWVNGTTCSVPYYGIKTRGALSIAFGTLFGITLMFTLMNLRKHGKLFLREDKRFRVIGRRWQWYWMCFVAACGMISCFTGVDVDRNYIQSIAIVLQSFFFALMLPGTLAIVWEATRHWGSFQERKICENDPYILPQDDRRAKVEFYLPLVFYFFAWMNFFMVIPRGWGRLEMQRSDEQTRLIAEPSATDGRLKAGGIIAVAALLVIVYSLHHSLKHYKLRGGSLWANISSTFIHTPLKLFASIIILAVRIAYSIMSAWNFNVSIFKYNVNPVWPFTLGYGTCLLIILVFEAAGWVEENEDKVVIHIRRERGVAANADMGYVPKPSWWNKAAATLHLAPEDRLKAMTTEIGGGRATSRNISANIELGNMNKDNPGTVRNRSKSRSPDDPFRDPSPGTNTTSGATAGGDDVYRTEVDTHTVRPGADRVNSDAASARTGMTGQTLTSDVPSQRIRSMLDV